MSHAALPIPRRLTLTLVPTVQAPYIVVIPLVVLALAGLVAGLILPAVQIRLYFISTIVPSFLNHLAFNIARGSALACDLGIVAALCWLLEERKTGVKRCVLACCKFAIGVLIDG